MKKIILPVDFSNATEKLVTEAIDFCKNISGEIYLTHIIPSDIGFVLGDIGSLQYYPEIEKNEISDNLAKLKEIQEQIQKENINCHSILKQGIAKDSILEYTREINADYIVIGSHGRSGVYDIFIGSLTKELTKNAPIPVVVIPIHGIKK